MRNLLMAMESLRGVLQEDTLDLVASKRLEEICDELQEMYTEAVDELRDRIREDVGVDDEAEVNSRLEAEL